MKKIYFAISYSNRKLFEDEITVLKSYFKTKGIELLVFVDRYNFKHNEEKIMIQTAFKEIDTCNFLIAELSTKSIGVGVEIGYAVAKNIPIIYLYKYNAEYATTAAGTAKKIIKYKNTIDLENQIKKVFPTLL